MKAFEEFTGMFDICIDQDDDIATEIQSVLDHCPGELRSRHLEQKAHDVFETRQTRFQKNEFRSE